MKIEFAKIRLYNRSPFLGTIIFNLPIVEATEKEGCPTLATDGKQIFYNKAFWDKHDSELQIGLLAHEVFHIVLGHIWRKKNHDDVAADPKTGMTIPLWNIATDYADNLLIRDMLGSQYTSGEMLLDDKYRDWSSEKIYEDLKKNMKQMTQKEMEQFMKNAQGKCLHDSGKWGSLSDKEKKDAKEKMDNLIQQGIHNQKQKGDLPAFLKRLWDEMQPKVNWRSMLRQYCERYSNDYTFSPTDRRYLEMDFALPSIDDGERIDWIAIAVDTSGSIGQRELSNFIGEIKGILSSFDQVKAKLTFCDAHAYPFEDLEEVNINTIKPKGGGGTDFRPVFDLIKKEPTAPKVLVYLTDGFGDFPAHRPADYDVMWIMTSEVKAPFGLTAPYEIT